MGRPRHTLTLTLTLTVAASFPEQSCHFGHRIGEVVSSKSGFAWVDPGNSRTPGFAATVQGSTLTLSLRPRLAGGFLSVAYECG